MSIEVVRKALLCCAVIITGMFEYGFRSSCWGHDWMDLLHSRWFRLSVDQFDMLHCAVYLQARSCPIERRSLHCPPNRSSSMSERSVASLTVVKAVQNV